jgi:anti-sigma factor RsiW
MSPELEHRECAEAIGAFALDALPDAEAARVRRHLEDCRECRGELERLRGAVEALPGGVPLVDPPPELKTRLMAIVEAEARLLQAAGEAADRPPRPRRRRWISWRPPLPAIATGALAVAAIATVAAILATSGAGVRELRARIADPALVGVAHASLRVSGSVGQLRVSGLPVPAADRVDELWVQRPGGSPQPAGTFVVQSGAVDVQRPVHRGDLVLLTVEPHGGSRAPTTPPLMTVRI